MKKYQVGDRVLIRRTSGSLDDAIIIDIVARLLRKRYIVKHTYRHIVEGMKTEYLEIKPKDIVCNKENTN